MSLRQKTLLLTILTLLCLLLILLVLSSVIWFGSAARLEQRDLQQGMNRVTTALTDELADLSRFNGDWAGWNDTYAFISDHNPAYIESNLTNETMIRGKISAVLFVDLSGRVVYSKTMDLDQRVEWSTSPQWAAHLPTLAKHEIPESNISGVVILDGKPFLANARPILTSDYQGPIRGTLIMGRELRAEQIRHLEQVTGLTLAVQNPHVAALPPDFSQAYRALYVTHDPRYRSTPSVYTIPLTEELAAAYTLLLDVTGEPALLLRSEAPRTAYQYAQTSMRTLVLNLLLLGLVFVALSVSILDCAVLRRLAQLESGVRHITDSGDLSARVPVTAHDELSSLARSINGMLVALEQAQQDNTRLYQETRRQLAELALLHTTAIASAHSHSLDAALQQIARSIFDAFKAANTMVIFWGPERGELKVRASVGLPAEALAAYQLQAGKGIVGTVAHSGEAILANDVMQDSRYAALDARTRSELCAPLKIGQDVIGVINIESDQLDTFKEADLQLLQTLAHNLSTSVENLRLLEDLSAANERLTELDRLKNRFVANMTHELRTPLNAILGFSELLIDEIPGPLNDDQHDYLQHIDTSGRHLLTLINDILDLSKLQANRVQLEQRLAYLADVATAAETFIWPSTHRKQQIMDIDLPPDLPGLYIDPLRVKQVLINLLSNAGKFTPPGGRIAVRAAVWREGWLRVSVSDTGPGIPPAEQAEVFEEFAQLNWDRPGMERGSGLGLAIARRLIELHGGKIWIESTGQPGEGTTFYFTLPVADRAARQQRTATRILVIGDDLMIIELLQSILPLPEYEIFSLTQPELVLRRVLQDQPDVILLDLLAPPFDGIQILMALQAEPRTAGIPIIGLTDRQLTEAEQAEFARLTRAILTKVQLRRETLLSLIQQVRSTSTAL